MNHHSTLKKDRSRYFDWFILAGLGMNALVVLTLVGFWLFH
jgi:hypothetical protein